MLGTFQQRSDCQPQHVCFVSDNKVICANSIFDDLQPQRYTIPIGTILSPSTRFATWENLANGPDGDGCHWDHYNTVVFFVNRDTAS